MSGPSIIQGQGSNTLPYNAPIDSIQLGGRSPFTNTVDPTTGQIYQNVVPDASGTYGGPSQVPIGPIRFPQNTIVIAENSALEYNVGMVKDNYFWYASDRSNKFGDQSTIAPQGNIPTTVAGPNELWTKAGGHKGMIVRHVTPMSSSIHVDAQWNADATPRTINGKRYGFQFHYNPTAINMSYDGASDVDPTFLMSGQNKFNPVAGAGLTQSSLRFDVLLNRKPDFKYYDSAGHLKPEAPHDLYAPRMPTVSEQEQIYAKGTMYDVDYLLGVLIGFSMDTQLRGNTTDIGFLIGAPVEVHLGKSMRYMGVIGGISVAHAFFDDRMVPTFSTVSITLSRMPDYQGE
jgi:hypothetical protein